MTSDNFVLVQQWMLEYDLSTKELLTYAIIYGFSQDGESSFYGSLQYLADWTKTSKMQIQRILKSLLAKKLISKTFRFENNIKQCFYKALRPKASMNTVSTVCTPCSRGMNTMTMGYEQDVHAPINTMCTNNKYIRNIKERENKDENAFAFSSEYANQLFDKWNGYGFLNRGKIEFFNRFGQCRQYLDNIHSDDVFKAIDNYKQVMESGGWYAQKHNLTFESFCKNIQGFLPGNFDIRNFQDKKTTDGEQKKEEKKITYYTDKPCPKCQKYMLWWNHPEQRFDCKCCGYQVTIEELWN